jgi:hypothetical protein
MAKRPRTSKPMHADSGKRRSLPRLGSDGDLPSLTEARRRMLSKPGFFSSLTPEAKAAMLDYEGPENLGPGKYED